MMLMIVFSIMCVSCSKESEDYIVHEQAGFISYFYKHIEYHLFQETERFEASAWVVGDSKTEKGEDIVIPSTIKFKGKTYIVNSILTGAFEDTQVRTINIPSSVGSISSRAFKNAQFLESVTFNSTTPCHCINDAFKGTHCKIYVPASAVNTYKNAWKSLADMIYKMP